MVAASAVWVAPLLVAPPLYSRDVYSYLDALPALRPSILLAVRWAC